MLIRIKTCMKWQKRSLLHCKYCKNHLNNHSHCWYHIRYMSEWTIEYANKYRLKDQTDHQSKDLQTACALKDVGHLSLAYVRHSLINPRSMAGWWRFPDVVHCHHGKADCQDVLNIFSVRISVSHDHASSPMIGHTLKKISHQTRSSHGMGG